MITEDETGIIYFSKPVQLDSKTMKSRNIKTVVSVGLSFFHDCFNADMAVTEKVLNRNLGMFCNFGYRSLLFPVKHDYLSVLSSTPIKMINNKKRKYK